MRVVVIGGTAFIGPYVVRGLSDGGHEVTVFHRGQTEPELPDGVKHIHGDMLDLAQFADEFKKARPDAVLHMVAGRAQDAWTCMRTFAGIAARVIAISSQDVYRAYNRLRRKGAGPPDAVPLSEEAPLRDELYPYRGDSFPGDDDPERRREIDDYDKILVERLVMGEPSLPGTVLRLPAVYGPNDSQHRLFNYLRRMDDGRPAILIGEEQSRWRWTRGYVENVAHAIILAVTNPSSQGQMYNVGEAEALTEAEWIKRIGQAAGWNGEILAVLQDQLPAHLKSHLDWAHDLVADTGKIRRELGYREPVAREEALARTVAWERAHPPEQTEAGTFDYEAEDRVLSQLVQTGG